MQRGPYTFWPSAKHSNGVEYTQAEAARWPVVQNERKCSSINKPSHAPLLCLSPTPAHTHTLTLVVSVFAADSG